MKTFAVKYPQKILFIIEVLLCGFMISAVASLCPWSVNAEQMVLSPTTNPAGSGTVDNMFLDDTAGDVWVGDPILKLPVRGWIEFGGYLGTGGFWSHPDWDITSVTLRIYVTNSNSIDCDVRVHSLQNYVNPTYGSILHLENASNTVIWDEIISGPALTGGCLGSIPLGWFDFPLDPNAVETMLRNTSIQYVGIGIREYLDDDDELKFSGWDSPNSPQLIINYDIIDTTAPTPNPMTWSSQPSASSSSQISMTASSATDSQSPPVSYFFDFVSSSTGGSGGTDSSWQSSTSYADSGLQANHSYSYRVMARDSASSPNATAYSSTVSRYTLSNLPGAAVFSNIAATSIRANWTTNGNRFVRDRVLLRKHYSGHKLRLDDQYLLD